MSERRNPYSRRTWLRRPLRVCALALALVTALPGATRAHDLLRISAGVGNQWSWTNSFDAMQPHDALLTGDVRLGVGTWAGFSVELGYRYMAAGDEAFDGTASTDLALHVIDLAARYDLPLLTWLSFYARAGASYGYARAELSSTGLSLAADDWKPGLFAMAGIEARLPRAWFGGEDDETGGRGFTFGLSLDVGYAWLLDFDLGGTAAPRGAGDAPDVSIARSGVRLGTLSLHGLTYRLALSLHY